MLIVCEFLGRFPHEVEALPFDEYCRITGYLDRKGERVKADAAKQAGKKPPKARGPRRRPRRRRR